MSQIYDTKYTKLHDWMPIDNLRWIDWCSNPNAIHILEQNLDKLEDDCWLCLCQNENAIHILEQNMDKLDDDCWYWLSGNPDSIRIL